MIFFKITQNFGRQKAFLRNLTNLSALDIKFATFFKLFLLFTFHFVFAPKKFIGKFYFCTYLRNPTIFCIVRQICRNLIKKIFSWIINWQVNVTPRWGHNFTPYWNMEKNNFLLEKVQFSVFPTFFQAGKIFKVGWNARFSQHTWQLAHVVTCRDNFCWCNVQVLRCCFFLKIVKLL